jgi:hypothetical protein
VKCVRLAAPDLITVLCRVGNEVISTHCMVSFAWERKPQRHLRSRNAGVWGSTRVTRLEMNLYPRTVWYLLFHIFMTLTLCVKKGEFTHALYDIFYFISFWH